MHAHTFFASQCADAAGRRGSDELATPAPVATCATTCEPRARRVDAHGSGADAAVGSVRPAAADRATAGGVRSGWRRRLDAAAAVVMCSELLAALGAASAQA